jgi:hypothetical protein
MKHTVYTIAALEVLQRGGYMRSRTERGEKVIRLFNEKGNLLPGYYTNVQIVLDGMNKLRGAIVKDGDQHCMEWVYNPDEEIFDWDNRPSFAPTVYRP